MSERTKGPDWWLVVLGGYLVLAVMVPALIATAGALWGAMAWIIRWAWWGIAG